MLNEGDLREFPGEVIRDSMPVDENNLDSQLTNENYYLDLQNAKPGFCDNSSTICKLPEKYRYIKPNPTDFDVYPLTVYGNVRPCSDCNEKALQYWFFYPWNQGPNKHEGDWEGIQIWLDANDIPLTVIYFFHHYRLAEDWDSESLKKLDNHPFAFIASGAHGSYSSPDKAIFSDSVSQKGVILTPEDMYYALIQEYPMNWQEIYNFVKIDESTIWVDFPGYWGEFAAGYPERIKADFSGPRGAGAKDRWEQPENFTDSDLPPWWISAQTGSPVNLHAYDSQGRHVGLNATGDMELEIPGVYAYAPSDNETETIILVTDDEITFVVEATDAGEFNMNVQRDLQTIKYLADYFNVNISSDSISNLLIGETNPSFRMAVDIDGDGSIDYYKYPDRLEVIGKKEADIIATMFVNNFVPGDMVSSRIYVENTGGSDIDDFLRITLTDPNGEKVYRELKPLYVKSREIETFKIHWEIPEDAVKGSYTLRIEFDDLDIDFLPNVRTFYVN